LLGGVLTQTMEWPWIFFVNLPVGLGALALCRPLLYPDPKPQKKRGGFDLPGAFLVTASIVAAVYAVVGAGQNPPAATVLLLLLSAALMVAFAVVERRAEAPLVPPGTFASSPNLTVSNVVMALAVVGMFGWFFFSALYLQRVLGYGSLATGLSYLPATIALGAISQGPAAWAVGRFGIKPTIGMGLGLMAAGLLLFARSPVGGSFLLGVLPGMLVLGVGASFGFMAVILASTTSVPESEAGLASGLVNTSQQMGGALGLAVLAAVAAASFSAPSSPLPCSASPEKRLKMRRPHRRLSPRTRRGPYGEEVVKGGRACRRRDDQASIRGRRPEQEDRNVRNSGPSNSRSDVMRNHCVKRRRAAWRGSRRERRPSAQAVEDLEGRRMGTEEELREQEGLSGIEYDPRSRW
jgi:hypothetical protein